MIMRDFNSRRTQMIVRGRMVAPSAFQTYHSEDYLSIQKFSLSVRLGGDESRLTTACPDRLYVKSCPMLCPML